MNSVETAAAIAIEFAQEPFNAQVWSADLMRQHWAELSHSPNLPLNPDFDQFGALADAGVLRIYTARFDGLLIGYGVFILGIDPFVKTRTLAAQTVLYLDPAYRRGWTGSHLLKFVHDQLKLEGVAAIVHAVSTRAPGLSILLERLGYRKQEEVWELPLEGR